jgi:hypothetical protein
VKTEVVQTGRHWFTIYVIINLMSVIRPCDRLITLSRKSYKILKKVSKAGRKFPERPRLMESYRSSAVVVKIAFCEFIKSCIFPTQHSRRQKLLWSIGWVDGSF